MDKLRLKDIFRNYLSKYDCNNPQAQFKIDHTYRVADLSYEIGSSLDVLPKNKADLCWFIGLLHDIGRFEQLKRYGNIADSKSIDHAELGTDILFKDGVINEFLKESITDMTLEQEKRIIEIAILNHNKYSLSNGLDETQQFFCDVIRDADKIDIFRIVCEIPYEIRMSKIIDMSLDPAREEIMKDVYSHASVKIVPNMTGFESTIMGCAMAFDIVFDRSKEIVKSQGYLEQMLSYEAKSMAQKEQMNMLREELSYLC